MTSDLTGPSTAILCGNLWNVAWKALTARLACSLWEEMAVIWIQELAVSSVLLILTVFLLAARHRPVDCSTCLYLGMRC